MPTETLNMPLSTLDEFDFSQGTDMDFDTDSPTTCLPCSTRNSHLTRLSS